VRGASWTIVQLEGNKNKELKERREKKEFNKKRRLVP
jgi:hypothetical protein